MVENLSTGMSTVVAVGKLIAALAICALSGVAWAVASVVGAAAADGHPPEYYDAGNRFAFFWSLLLLIMICPVASPGCLRAGPVRGLVDLAVSRNGSTRGCDLRGAGVRAVRW